MGTLTLLFFAGYFGRFKIDENSNDAHANLNVSKIQSQDRMNVWNETISSQKHLCLKYSEDQKKRLRSQLSVDSSMAR